MADDAEKKRKDRVFKAVMLGLMAGSAVFLGERYLLKLDADTSLIVATFCAVAVAVYLLQKIDKT